MSIRIAGQVIASAGSLTAHNEDPNAHPDIRELIGQGGGGGGYSKKEIDNKFAVVDTAILGNAEAIQKTRNDFIASDSELQQQINVHANEITTNKNDIDGLGDEVAEIESKIPEGTSDTNPLINKQQLLDEEMDIREDMMQSDSELQTQINALAEAIQGGGGASVPDNVYTKTNLLGGKDIEIVPEPVESGIDENTLACWHFDGKNTDEVNGLALEYIGISGNDPYDTNRMKFGTACTYDFSSSSLKKNDISSLNITDTDLTLDFWFYQTNYQSSGSGKYGLETGSKNILAFKIYRYEIQLEGNMWGSSAGTKVDTSTQNTWTHVALQYDHLNNKGYLFVNGQKVYEGDVTDVTGQTFKSLYLGHASGPSLLIDELRISNVLRWTEDFTPPTEPYLFAEPTGNYQINFTGEAGGAGASFPLFYHTFTDHILNDASWLRSDTFSWQSGDVYVSAYNHLVEEFEGLTAETETVGSTEITFYRAEDGHKIVLADQESNVSAIYAETGVAWYYILDTENKRFKLPRDGNRFRLEANKELLDWDKQETISNGFVAPSGGFIVVGVQANDTDYRAYVTPKGGTQVSVYGGYNNDAGGQWSFIVNEGDTFSASAFNNGIFVPFLPSVKGVEEDRKKFLYLFVGNTVRNQTEIDVGIISEALNSKADLDFGNVSEAGKEASVSWSMPDYENGIEITNIAKDVFVQVEKDSFVLVFGADPITENYYAYVSPDGGVTKYMVGKRTDDHDSYTQTTSFTFFVPAGWYFSNGAEAGSSAFIYPLRGAK